MKRREFLKNMVIAGASATGAMGMGNVLVTPRTAHAADRNKLIFISDTHLNISGSYTWLNAHAPYLTAFLSEVNTRSDVAELIILGDMLDDWVTPVGYTPQTFSDILAANYSNGLVPALQALCQNPNMHVTYVTGNHDLLSFESGNKAIIEAAFPGMTIISDEPGLGAYSKNNVIWAEHGHRYTLFNAPDIWSKEGSHLPIGYFITRLVASESDSSARTYTTREVLDRFLRKTPEVNRQLRQSGYDQESDQQIDDKFVFALYNAIVRWSGVSPVEKFNMNSLDNFTSDPLVEAISYIYDTIYSGWPDRQNIVGHNEAILNEIGYLADTANLLFEMPDRIKQLYPFTPRIVLFGHTHKPFFQYSSGEVDTIYANTGTWIDNTPNMTWVEIEIGDTSEGTKDYTVSLWYYGETTPRQSGTVTG